MRLFVHNRTHARAEELARVFGGTAVEELEAGEVPPLDAVIATVPAEVRARKLACARDCVRACALTAVAQARFELPDFLLDSQPVVVELAFRPRTTLLLAQARAMECPCVEGIDVLVEQGLAQFALWAGRPAPADKMETVVRAHYDRQASALPRPAAPPSVTRALTAQAGLRPVATRARCTPPTPAARGR